jgi:CRP-like cAMP-binding protein
VTRISTERQLLQMFGSGLTSEDLAEVIETAELKPVRAGEAIIKEGTDDFDMYVIRSGSMVVEKSIGGKPVFLSYLPAGSYVGEMALIDRSRRTATVRAAIKSEVIKLDGEAFRRLLDRKPDLLAKAKRDMASRQDLNAFVEAKKDSFSTVVDMYSSVANFLVENGVGEATDVLLIDENLCVGCDNCEKACADSHDGLSRLDREAGRTYAHLHVPTVLPPLRASALHGRLPAQRDPSRAGRRGVHRRDLHRLRQLPAQLPLWRDPHGQGAAEEAGAAQLAVPGLGPGSGRAEQGVGLCQCRTRRGEAQKGDQVRYVFGDRGRPCVRARLPHRRRDPRRARASS